MTLLNVQGLSKSFGGVQALRGVGFSLAKGEMLAMIGPNGAGKSTCFNVIAGVLAPDAGKIFLENQEIGNKKPHRICALGVARTFQVAAAFGSMTVRENVQVALAARAGRLGSVFGNLDAAEEAETLLTQAGILPLADRPCGELAYGDLKRVELAIALAARPRLLLMDEPTAGMAADERRALMELVKGIARTGVAVLFTEHDMDAVFGYADRVIVLFEGELIASGTPDAVRANAQVRAVYLGEEA